MFCPLESDPECLLIVYLHGVEVEEVRGLELSQAAHDVCVSLKGLIGLNE